MKNLAKAKWFALGMVVTLLVSTVIIPAIAATLDVALNSINIKVNGVQVAAVGDTMKLSNGNEVPFSIVYQGTTYLPLGKLAELFGKDAAWDGAANTAVISDKSAATPAPPVGETMGQKNALRAAKDYLSALAFSHAGLIKQLEFEGYSNADAKYAADNCGADWNEQAARAAKEYLDVMSFSRSSLIKQLEHDGFTNAQAIYGVEANGY